MGDRAREPTEWVKEDIIDNFGDIIGDDLRRIVRFSVVFIARKR